MSDRAPGGARSTLWRVIAFGVWLVGGGMLVGAVFVGSFYFAMQRESRSTEVKVPELVGLTIEQARAAAAPLDLLLDVVEERNDPRMASGHVLGQTPLAGSSVRRGRKVKLVLSLGGRVLQVPELSGSPSRTTTIELGRQGFAVGNEAHVFDPRVAAGLVLAQVPPSGTPAVPATPVHRLVSRGPRPAVWVMPDLTGRSRDEVEKWIDLSGFRLGAVRQVSIAGRRRGQVVGQAPLAGHPVEARGIVELSIAE